MHGTRFTDKYLQARQSFSRSSYSPYFPSRPSAAKTPPSSPKAIPHSPPRKVVTDFAAFGAPSSGSVFKTAVASTPFSVAGGSAAFAGIRSGGSRTMFDDDDEDDEDGIQKVELKEGFITLDQVRPSFSRCSSSFLTFGRRGELRYRARGVARPRNFMMIYARSIPHVVTCTVSPRLS